MTKHGVAQSSIKLRDKDLTQHWPRGKLFSYILDRCVPRRALKMAPYLRPKPENWHPIERENKH